MDEDDDKSYVFRVEFQTGNAAFSECSEWEVHRILKKLSEEVKMGAPGSCSGKIRDINGNTIGEYEWVEEE